MSTEANPLDYWTPATPMAARDPEPAFCGPRPTGCLPMLGVTVAAAGIAYGIVVALGWVLAF